MKVQVEIEIPDGHEILRIAPINQIEHSTRDGWVYEFEYRIATKAAKPFLINGVPSDWPEWLDCDWVAKDESGAVWGYDGDPPQRHGFSTWKVGVNAVGGRIFGTTLTIPGPFEKSLRENPRRKK